MSLTVCQLHFTQQADKALYISDSLIKQLKLAGKKTAVVKLGYRTIQLPIRTLKKRGSHVYFTAPVRSHLRAPREGNCYIRSTATGNLQIGPLMGVLTSATGSLITPFGGRTPFIKQIISAGAKKAFYFAFSPTDVNWQNDTINGYFLNPDGSWSRRVVPLPDVVYNRHPSRAVDASLSMEQLKERFVKRQIPLFNWNFFSKWEVYRLLENDPEATRHVPESFINPSPDRIQEMLHKHQFVYLKPTGGSLGIGIYRLTYHPRDGYFVRYRKNGSNVLLRYTRFSSLMQMLKLPNGRLKNYVVQQGIRLLEIDGCPLDFRFHMHKTGSNNWVVVGIGAKKAGRGSVTTHIKNGGKLMTPEHALSRAIGSRSEDTLQRAKQVSIKLAEAIERNYPHTIGELGFDIGIDKSDNIWMFEANAKPGRSIFKHPELKQQGVASLNHIFEHCLYLSKFRTRRDD